MNLITPEPNQVQSTTNKKANKVSSDKNLFRGKHFYLTILNKNKS